MQSAEAESQPSAELMAEALMLLRYSTQQREDYLYEVAHSHRRSLQELEQLRCLVFELTGPRACR